MCGILRTGDPMQDIKTFQNPTGFWDYAGAFSIELDSERSADMVIDRTLVTENKISVQSGEIHQSMGGIDFLFSGQTHHFGYRHLQIIRDGEGNLLWVNNRLK